MSKRLSKFVLVVLIVSAATAVWIPHQRGLAEGRAEFANAQARRVELEEHIKAATAELESVRRELHLQNTSRKQTRSAIEQAETKLNEVDPESRWVTPPVSLPDWNDESPYVWLQKHDLPYLAIQAFTESGALNDEVASVLTLDEKQKAALNSALTNILAQYHSIETARAKKTDEHLPSVAGEEGEKLTIRVEPQPEEGKRIKEQFEAALRNEIGAQRADLLLLTSGHWLDQQFSQSGSEPKTISVVRQRDGYYSISIKGGGGSFSTSGPWKYIQGNIPVHIRPMFEEIAPQP